MDAVERDAGGGGGRHVLVAEDSPTQAELLREVLVEAGFTVTVAGNGVEALQAARQQRPAVIVTDVMMPDMDGYALCRAVKDDALLHDVPVMIVTSLRDADDIVRALESGADNFIRKPFDPDALVARIDFLLANRALRAQGRPVGGVEITLAGRRHVITAERERILDLLFSSYEEAVQANEELRQHQQEVQMLNLRLAADAVELEEANRQLRSFSHAVSHDLRSPLGSIVNLGTVLSRRHAEGLDPKGQRYLEAIRQEAGRMMRIVDDVLYLANIDRARVSRSDVDLAQLAREAVAALREGDPERQVQFDCTATSRAHCDERLLRIALANLLGNAWKFSARRDGARIAFGVEAGDDGEAVFRVEDNGVGFDMAYAHRLFKPFERLHGSDEFQGFGIGLATVQRIVALHGGRIWPEAAPGQGARFRFTLGREAGSRG